MTDFSHLYVDPKGTKNQAADLETAAHDLESILMQEFVDSTATLFESTEDIVGEYAAGAYDRFKAAWDAEIGFLASALTELSDALSNGSDYFMWHDQQTTDDLRPGSAKGAR
jgi:uncharacterized protein YukE